MTFPMALCPRHWSLWACAAKRKSYWTPSVGARPGQLGLSANKVPHSTHWLLSSFRLSTQSTLHFWEDILFLVKLPIHPQPLEGIAFSPWSSLKLARRFCVSTRRLSRSTLKRRMPEICATWLPLDADPRNCCLNHLKPLNGPKYV